MLSRVFSFFNWGSQGPIQQSEREEVDEPITSRFSITQAVWRTWMVASPGSLIRTRDIEALSPENNQSASSYQENFRTFSLKVIRLWRRRTHMIHNNLRAPSVPLKRARPSRSENLDRLDTEVIKNPKKKQRLIP